MIRSVFYLFVTITLLSACQKNEVPQETTLFGATALVSAADGTTYSVDCLRNKSSEIQALGDSAMKNCAVDLKSSSPSERGRFLNTSYSWIYNPATYCSPSYYNYTYPTNYRPYNDTRFKNNTFCAFIFGSNTSFNCYYLFGYTNSNYANYYNSNCNSCLYSSSCNYSCWQNHYWY